MYIFIRLYEPLLILSIVLPINGAPSRKPTKNPLATFHDHKTTLERNYPRDSHLCDVVALKKTSLPSVALVILCKLMFSRILCPSCVFDRKPCTDFLLISCFVCPLLPRSFHYFLLVLPPRSAVSSFPSAGLAIVFYLPHPCNKHFGLLHDDSCPSC